MARKREWTTVKFSLISFAQKHYASCLLRQQYTTGTYTVSTSNPPSCMEKWKKSSIWSKSPDTKTELTRSLDWLVRCTGSSKRRVSGTRHLATKCSASASLAHKTNHRCSSVTKEKNAPSWQFTWTILRSSRHEVTRKKSRRN